MAAQWSAYVAGSVNQSSTKSMPVRTGIAGDDKQKLGEGGAGRPNMMWERRRRNRQAKHALRAPVGRIALADPTYVRPPTPLSHEGTR